VAGYSGDAGNALKNQANSNRNVNGMMFSTPDSDNDATPTYDCGKYGGWWRRRCSASNINKRYNGVWTTGTKVNDVQASRMLVKLN